MSTCTICFHGEILRKISIQSGGKAVEDAYNLWGLDTFRQLEKIDFAFKKDSAAQFCNI